ncbi:DUF551 domain-containing protein [Pasteurellaceae bacterium TAE3-ERU1]|nr:DUF551 domain-containing protein [Pasteurellaceae bacterium TAE3-ERU1]
MKWIKCSERLLEYSDELPFPDSYLIIGQINQFSQNEIMIAHYCGEGLWSCGCWNPINVTHWQPLPKPPKD